MSARRHLSPDQFKFDYDEDVDTHRINAYHPSFGGGTVPIGTFTWAKQGGISAGWPTPPGEITNVEVMPEFRRQGVATGMYNRAQQYEPRPLHSRIQTDKGYKWARSVGGGSVKDEQKY